MSGLHPIFKGMSTKMAQSEERGPGHSEQGTWCSSWNGGQTEGTSDAHGSWPWAWTNAHVHVCISLTSHDHDKQLCQILTGFFFMPNNDNGLLSTYNRSIIFYCILCMPLLRFTGLWRWINFDFLYFFQQKCATHFLKFLSTGSNLVSKKLASLSQYST